MKNFLWILAALLLVGCDDGTSEYKREAQGAPYEVVVVADHSEWEGPVGDTLRQMLGARYPMVNRDAETMFSVLRVLPEGFKRLVPRHRNILIVNVNPAATEATLQIQEDVHSRPQVVLTATAPDNEAMLNLIGERGADIMLVLETAERQRDVAAAKGHTPPEIAELIRTKFGFEMSMGPEYKVRNDADNFLWVSYEPPTFSQGIIVYTYPFGGSTDLQLPALLDRRDEFVALIPGENPGSHMATNRDYTSLIYKTINGRSWAELHGFWYVQGDFMGGPFTNYTTLVSDERGDRIVSIDFYVYAPDPRYFQRNFIKKLEHYLYTVNF